MLLVVPWLLLDCGPHCCSQSGKLSACALATRTSCGHMQPSAAASSSATRSVQVKRKTLAPRSLRLRASVQHGRNLSCATQRSATRLLAGVTRRSATQAGISTDLPRPRLAACAVDACRWRMCGAACSRRRFGDERAAPCEDAAHAGDTLVQLVQRARTCQQHTDVCSFKPASIAPPLIP